MAKYISETYVGNGEDKEEIKKYALIKTNDKQNKNKDKKQRCNIFLASREKIVYANLCLFCRRT